MLGSNKPAVLALLLAGLAVTGTGVAHALVDDAAAPKCSRDAQGNEVCSQTTERKWTSEDGTVHVQQKQQCSSEARNRQYGFEGTYERNPQEGAVLNCTVRGPV